jgi:hypothetical protein
MSSFPALPLHRHSAAAAPRVSLWLRLKVYIVRGSLDRQIAAGRLCGASPALRLRTRQLSDRHTRLQLARSLRKVVAYAEASVARPIRSAVVIETGAVLGARHPILGTAERLEGTAPVHPSGVAMVQVLLTDGLSPLFNRCSERTIVEALWEVADALETDLALPGLGAAA